MQHLEDVPFAMRNQASHILRRDPEDWMLDMMEQEWRDKATLWVRLAPE